jgi:hypothetical protein
MEVGHGPNWGCSAKEKEKRMRVGGGELCSFLCVMLRVLFSDASNITCFTFYIHL